MAGTGAHYLRVWLLLLMRVVSSFHQSFRREAQWLKFKVVGCLSMIAWPHHFIFVLFNVSWLSIVIGTIEPLLEVKFYSPPTKLPESNVFTCSLDGSLCAWSHEGSLSWGSLWKGVCVKGSLVKYVCVERVSVKGNRDPQHWHLVVATEADGTHPTGMHSCLLKFWSDRIHQKWFFFTCNRKRSTYLPVY